MAHPRTRPQRPTKRNKSWDPATSGCHVDNQRVTPLLVTGSRIPRRKLPKRSNLVEAEVCFVWMVGFGEDAVYLGKATCLMMWWYVESLRSVLLPPKTHIYCTQCLSEFFNECQSHGSSSDSPSSAPTSACHHALRSFCIRDQKQQKEQANKLQVYC